MVWYVGVAVVVSAAVTAVRKTPALTISLRLGRCFQLRFNLIDVLSKFGGLLFIMLFVLRITFSLALAIISILFEIFVQPPVKNEIHWYKIKLNHLVGIVIIVRIVLAFIAYIIELCAIVVIFFVPTITISPSNIEIGFEAVLIIGLFTSCLLLPLEEYSLTEDQKRRWSQPIEAEVYEQQQLVV